MHIIKVIGHVCKCCRAPWPRLKLGTFIYAKPGEHEPSPLPVTELSAKKGNIMNAWFSFTQPIPSFLAFNLYDANQALLFDFVEAVK